MANFDVGGRRVSLAALLDKPARASRFISGDKEIESALKKLPRRLQRRVIRSAAAKAAKPIEDLVKINTPVRQAKYRTASARGGAMKRNVKRRAVRRPRRYAAIWNVGTESGKVPGKTFKDGRGKFAVTNFDFESGNFTFRKLSRREARNEDPYYVFFQERGFTHWISGKFIPARNFVRDAVSEADAARSNKIYYDQAKKFIIKFLETP